MPRWDALVGPGAENFLAWLLPEDESDCRRIILDRLCDNPRPENNPARLYANYYPNRPGTIECAIGRWYFRYGILNENTIEVFSIGISPANPNHPMRPPPEL